MLQLILNGNSTYSVSHDDGNWSLNETAVSTDVQGRTDGVISILQNGKSYTGIIESIDRPNKTIVLRIDGTVHHIAVEESIDRLLKNMGLDMPNRKKADAVKAPMPGMVLEILVEPGQILQKGDAILVLEAMKMENVLKSPGAATVKAVHAVEKTAVEKGEVLIELE